MKCLSCGKDLLLECKCIEYQHDWQRQVVQEDMKALESEFGIVGPFKGPWAPFSNFHFVPEGINFLGHVVRSSEHAFQMMKATTKEDRLHIAAAPNAVEAKKRGREVKCREDWKQIRYISMLSIQRVKYFNHYYLAKLLLSTEYAIIVELNWWGDREWGYCKGEGLNLLGKALMKVREELRRMMEI